MVITSQNLATATAKLIAVDALQQLVDAMTMGNLVTRDFEPVVAQAGDTVHIGKSEVVLTTHAEATFQVPDVTKVIAVPDLLRIYMQPAILALTEKIEGDLLSLYSRLTELEAIGPGQPGMTLAKIEEADDALFIGGVKSGDPKYLTVDVRAYSDLRRVDKFSEYANAYDAGLSALVNGSVGKILNFFVLRSQNVKRDGDPALAHNIAFSKDALGMAIRRIPRPLPGTGDIAEYSEVGSLGVRIVTNYQPNTLSQQYTIGILYGVSVLCSQHCVEVRS